MPPPIQILKILFFLLLFDLFTASAYQAPWSMVRSQRPDLFYQAWPLDRAPHTLALEKRAWHEERQLVRGGIGGLRYDNTS